jgi:hypothetical protein
MEYIRIGPRVGPVTSTMALASTRKARANADLREMIARACGLDKARMSAWGAFARSKLASAASEPAGGEGENERTPRATARTYRRRLKI